MTYKPLTAVVEDGELRISIGVTVLAQEFVDYSEECQFDASADIPRVVDATKFAQDVLEQLQRNEGGSMLVHLLMEAAEQAYTEGSEAVEPRSAAAAPRS